MGRPSIEQGIRRLHTVRAVRKLSLTVVMSGLHQAIIPLMLALLGVLIPFGIVWGGEVEAPKPYGWRWGVDPMTYRRPQPSLLGTTSNFDLQAVETLQRGNLSLGLFGTFEKLFTADLTDGSDLARLRMDRYGLTLTGAYSILDNLELGISVLGAVTDAEFRQDIATG